MIAKPDKTIRDLILQKVFGFDEADLEANRVGEISPLQRMRLDKIYQARRRKGWQPMLVLVGFQAIGFTDNIIWREYPYVFVILLPIVSIFLMTSFYRLSTIHRLQSGQIQTVEGTAHLGKGYGMNSKFYTLRLGGKQFQLISPAEYEAFHADTRYRLYYIASAPAVILSVESL